MSCPFILQVCNEGHELVKARNGFMCAQCIIYCEMSDGSIQEVSYSWIKQNNAKWPGVGTTALLANRENKQPLVNFQLP